MKEISQQLLYQRLRNRAIELFEMHSSFKDVAAFGAFEMINLVDDRLPLDYAQTPGVFSKAEQEIIGRFLEAFETAAETTQQDMVSIEWFENSADWVRLNDIANQAVAIFAKRGRFSEETEENLPK